MTNPAPVAPEFTFVKFPGYLLEATFDVLQHYANECTYQGERVGGVLSGCPRGPVPLPDALAVRARLLLRNFEPAARAALAAQVAPATVKPTFSSGVALRKWESLMNDGYRMTELRFERSIDGANTKGTIDAWGKVLWIPALWPPVAPVHQVGAILERIDIKAEAGLCAGTFAGAREFFKDIRQIVKENT